MVVDARALGMSAMVTGEVPAEHVERERKPGALHSADTIAPVLISHDGASPCRVAVHSEQ